jgi:hypothetical protein
MQLRNCANEGMLCFLVCWSYFIVDDVMLLFVALIELLGLCMLLLLVALFYCLWVAYRTWSGHESAGPLWACMAWKYWSLKRMCEGWWLLWSSSAGILTCIKSLVMVLRAFCHHIRTIHNTGSFSFVLMRMIRSSLHCIKLTDQRSLIIKFKSHNPFRMKPNPNCLRFHFTVIH